MSKVRVSHGESLDYKLTVKPQILEITNFEWKKRKDDENQKTFDARRPDRTQNITELFLSRIFSKFHECRKCSSKMIGKVEIVNFMILNNHFILRWGKEMKRWQEAKHSPPND